MEPDEQEVVPITKQDEADIAEAYETWRRVETVRPTGETLARGVERYISTLGRILASHGFEPINAGMSWGAEKPLELKGRRIK